MSLETRMSGEGPERLETRADPAGEHQSGAKEQAIGEK